MTSNGGTPLVMLLPYLQSKKSQHIFPDPSPKPFLSQLHALAEGCCVPGPEPTSFWAGGRGQILKPGWGNVSE